MLRALLDINVVIALLDQGHGLHRSASRWVESELEHGWATCPITQNGVVRIKAGADALILLDTNICIHIINAKPPDWIPSA